MSGRGARIGMVCFPSLGGSGVVATQLAVELARRGHEVHLLSSAPPSRGLTAHENLHLHVVRGAEHPLFPHPPYTVALASAMVEVAKTAALDLFHVHYAVPHAASAALARATLGAAAPKLVTSLHGTDVTRLGADPSYAAVTRFAVQASDLVVVPSTYLAGAAQRTFELVEPERLVVLSNFVDTEVFFPATPAPEVAAEPLLVHVSNFRPVKRVGDTLEVLRYLREHIPARLALVGDGPDLAATRARADALGLTPFVSFLGSHVDLAGTLRRADAFLLPSESESFGLAALEAMSTGVPVAAYRVGGLPELVTPEVGALVEPFDVRALAEAVRGIVTVPARHAAMRRAARERALEIFAMPPAVSRYEALYERLLAGRGGP